MSRKSLHQLYVEHTGKVSDKWSLYLTEYDRLFDDFRDKPIRLLEIGIQNGGSLEIWSKYFSNASALIGCDINSDCARLTYDDTRISVIVGDANALDTSEQVFNRCSQFDIIIDDGSHLSSDIIKSFALYFTHLVEGGLFVAEDLHCSYWSQFEGGLYNPYSSISFFKRLADVINHEHWGIAKARSGILQSIFGQYGFYVEIEESLSQTHSIEFVNSMCIVRKALITANTLGTQIIGGSLELITPGRKILHERQYEYDPIFEQSNNPWTARGRAPDEEVFYLEQELVNLKNEVVDWEFALAKANHQAENLEQKTVTLQNEINGLRNSMSWKITGPFRTLKYSVLKSKIAYKKLRELYSLSCNVLNSSGGLFATGHKVLKIVRSEGVEGVIRRVSILQTKYRLSVFQSPVAKAYRDYISAFEPNDQMLSDMKNSVSSLAYRPKFSIIIPVYNVDEKWLTACIESVLGQIYPDWELCLADDHSTLPHIRPLLEAYSSRDKRIHIVFRDTNGHISEATNSALDLATGDFMCLMDNDDEISSNALYEFALLLNRDQSIDMIYSDEDKLDIEGNRYEPFFKPDWSPEALEGCMYTAHLACYRMILVREIGGFYTDFNGAQDYDFVLRFTERAAKIAHIPKILYHWRAIPGSTAASMEAKDYVLDAALRALTERANRVAGGGEARLGLYSGSFDLRYNINGSPLVSIVIPSAGNMAQIRGKNVDLLVQAVSSICKRTLYRNFEIIIVDNNDLRSETVEAIKMYGCHYIHFDGEFNIATKMNMGAREARGKYILFMNDDIEVISRDWMECMLQLCQRKGVGVVGAKLHFEDESLQHVGVTFWEQLPDHIHRGFHKMDPGYFFSAVANRNYLAVTGAVLMTKRELFEAVGGFDEQFAVNYNDIDYCLKAFSSGYRIVYAAGAKLFHYESVSRERVVAAEEITLFQQKWKDTVSYDPYYSVFFGDHPPVYALRHEWSRLSLLDPEKAPVISHR